MGWKYNIEHFPHIDKIVNFIIGGLLFFVLFPTFSALICLLIILGVALIKELYDWHVQDWENVDLWDTFWVITGAVIVCIFYIL